MNWFDFVVVAAYLACMLALGYGLRDQRTKDDYFLGGKRMGWFPLTLSAMATQLSAISFISAPAFVGWRQGGGLSWLTYEFGVPVAMILVMFFIAPPLYRSGVISIYDFLEQRIGRSTRLLVSAAFQVTRSFATGIMVYAMAIILEAVVAVPFWQSVTLVSVITILYSLQGGMRAVVYSDAIQMTLIVVGLLLCGFIAVDAIGGVDRLLEHVEASRLEALRFSSLGLSTDEFGFWPMLLGGIVLYASYYGCDQSQTQRVLSAKNLAEVRRLLLANGLLRFPLTLLYCLVGLAIGALISLDPEVARRIPADEPDLMVPIFMLEYLPHGLIGLLVVAILSAAMSSLSGTINSLSAVTGDDLTRLGFGPRDERSAVIRSRFLAFGWGAVVLIFSVFGGQIAPTVIEAINKVGSALYGPVLATFLLAILRPGARPLAANAGLLAGVALNLLLWRLAPGLFWMWWNVIGFVVAGSVALAMTAAVAERSPERGDASALPVPGRSTVARFSGALLLYLLFIVGLSGSFAWLSST